MNQHDKQRVGEQLEPGGRPKAPGRLELLRRFINSYNHELPREWDRLATKEKAQAWLREKRLVAPGERVSDADAEPRLLPPAPHRCQLSRAERAGTVIQVEQRFYPPALVSNAIVGLYLGGALTGSPFIHGLWTRSPQTRLAMWVLTGVLACLAFRLRTELLRRGDRRDFGYWLSLSVQAHDMGAWRRWRQAS